MVDLSADPGQRYGDVNQVIVHMLVALSLTADFLTKLHVDISIARPERARPMTLIRA
jgi:hypothetical protein